MCSLKQHEMSRRHPVSGPGLLLQIVFTCALFETSDPMIVENPYTLSAAVLDCGIEQNFNVQFVLYFQGFQINYRLTPKCTL